MKVFARHNRQLFFGAGVLFFMTSGAQSLLFPTDYMFDLPRQRALALDTAAEIHTSLQPYRYEYIKVDTFKNLKHGADNFWDKVFYEDLISVKHIDKSSGYDRKFNFTINPILDLYRGKDVNDTASAKVETNTRGFWIKGELGKKLVFESAFFENQAYTPEYIFAFGKTYGVVPGQGRWKTFKTNGFDYAAAYGILNYEATKNFTLRLGHGKQKIGNGYRSLLLSDNSMNYPYVQFIAKFLRGKLQYSQTYALLMNVSDGGAKTPPNTEPIYQKKAATFQHLSWRTGKYLDMYVFEGTVWKATDSNNVMHLDPMYANPVIFANLVKYGFNNDANHALGGGGFEFRPIRTLHIYNQYMYDGTYLWPSGKNKANWGMQAGIKYFDAFGLRNLYIQAEGNLLSGRSYYSTKWPTQDYSHYNQLLTTPALLSNEVIGMISYSYKRLFVQAKCIFQSDNSSEAVMNYFDAKVGYMVNQRYNLNISAGSTSRSFLSGVPGVKASEVQLFYVNLRTSLTNLYYDF